MPGENDRPTSPLLAGRYVLGEPFASGGMGSVHLGRIVGASGFSRVVAIKRLFPGFSGDGSFRQMLLDEARFASRIRQPNVVPILDVVESERDLYVVMEYVHGLPLAAALSSAGDRAMPVPIALAIAEAVLFGLHAAHEARNEDGTALGIVHRDVSPQNVLVGADGVPRLIDFGIAKAATRIQATDPGVLKGKAGYMAPEQLLYEPISRHADIFSASVVLWEMLAARRLFPYDVSERVRRASEPLAPPSRHRSEIDSALDAVVLRGLSRDPGRRFPTAEAMALELRRDHEIASAVEVGRWLAEAAPDELEISEERVRLFEQTPSYRSPETPAPPPPVTAVPTVSTIPDAWHAEKPKARGRGWLIAGAAIVAALAALLAPRLVSRAAPPAAIASPAEPSLESRTALAPVASSMAPVGGASSPSASVGASAPLPPSTASTPAAPVASAAALGKGHARKAKAKCDPPYTIDADGFKHYDHNCF